MAAGVNRWRTLRYVNRPEPGLRSVGETGFRSGRGGKVIAVNLQPSDQNIEPTESPEPGSDDFDGWFGRGLKFAQLGFPDRAVESFEQAEVIRPDDATIQFNLGTAHLTLGNFVQAVVSLDRAITLDPSNSDAYGNRAVAHAGLGEEELAGRDVETAVSLGAPLEGIEAVLDYVRGRANPEQD